MMQAQEAYVRARRARTRFREERLEPVADVRRVREPDERDADSAGLEHEGAWSIEDVDVPVLREQRVRDAAALVVPGEEKDRDSAVRDVPERRERGVREPRRDTAPVNEVAAVEHHVDVAGPGGREGRLEALDEVAAAGVARAARSLREVVADVRVGEEEDAHGTRPRGRERVYSGGPTPDIASRALARPTASWVGLHRNDGAWPGVPAQGLKIRGRRFGRVLAKTRWEMRILPFALLLSAVLPVSAGADAAGACHCYRDRSFDPARPEAADPYILATTRSSLLSAAFGASKRELVQSVMTGTSPEDLWIAHWAAASAQSDAAALLDAKRAAGSWKAAFRSSPRLAERLEAATAAASSDSVLAATAAADVITSRLGVDGSVQAALRRAGASTSETILAVVIAKRLGTYPPTVLAPVKSGKASWGMVLQELGLVPKDIDGIIRQMVAR
jgi:hypothetical protein